EAPRVTPQEPGTARSMVRYWNALANYRFTILLVALTLLLLAAPAVNLLAPPEQQRSASHITITAFLAIVMITAGLAITRGRKTFGVAILLALPAIILQGLPQDVSTRTATMAEYILSLLFLSYVMALILTRIFRSEQVSFDTISASLCVYLLLGIAWAIAYSLLDIWEPGQSFRFGLGNEDAEGLMRFGGDRSIFPIYYSFVTMTTLGYGDILPNSPSARMLSSLEAVMGQLYLIVLVARLVGIHIAHSVASKSK
ncbi:MAG: potassium channel family protein, partial [Pirellulales bacterium]